MPHSDHLRPYGVVTRKGRESSNYARIRHGWYKNVDCHTIFTWPRQLYAYQNFTQPRNVPWLAPPWRCQLIWGVGAERPSTWGGTSQNLGQNDRVWGGSTRGGSTEGRIDRYPQFRHMLSGGQQVTMSDERRPLLSSSSPDSMGQPARSASSSPLDPDSWLSPSGRARWKTRASFILILVTETLERTAFYGLLCNMFMFLNSNPMSWASYNAATIIFVLSGVAYITAIFGGWLADSYLGQFRTIIIFFCIYAVGFAFWPFFYPYPYETARHNPGAAAWCRVDSNNSASDNIVPFYKENCWWAVYLSIAIVGLGYGIVRVNIIPYGAFQVL